MRSSGAWMRASGGVKPISATGAPNAARSCATAAIVPPEVVTTGGRPKASTYAAAAASAPGPHVGLYRRNRRSPPDGERGPVGQPAPQSLLHGRRGEGGVLTERRPEIEARGAGVRNGDRGPPGPQAGDRHRGLDGVVPGVPGEATVQ
jgi:hypothetical protein